MNVWKSKLIKSLGPNGARIYLCAISFLLASCGGADIGSGGTGNGIGSGGTGATVSATAVGPITGFGSVIVNGVKFDESSASISDDRSNAVTKDKLAMGMVVQISGDVASDTLIGTATSIKVFSELRGAVTAIDSAAGTLTLMGGTVQTTVTTTFANVAGLSALSVGDVVEIYGLRNPSTQALAATRVEKKTDLAAANFLVGVTRATNALNKTFVIGPSSTPVTVNFSAATILPSGTALLDGQRVRVEISPATVGATVNAVSVQVTDNVSAPPSNNGFVEIEGLVTDFANLASFKLNGVLIDASAANVEQGSVALLKNGARVEVSGFTKSAVLFASRIRIQAANDNTSLPNDNLKYDVRGQITSYTSLADFTVRGVRIDGSQATFKNGTAAQVVLNATVRARGVMKGDRLIANEISF